MICLIQLWLAHFVGTYCLEHGRFPSAARHLNFQKKAPRSLSAEFSTCLTPLILSIPRQRFLERALVALLSGPITAIHLGSALYSAQDKELSSLQDVRPFSHRLPLYPQLPTLNVQEATTLRLQNTPAFPLVSNCFVSLSAPMCLNVLRTSHCCICRLETVLATSSCDADPISTPNWSRKRHQAQGWMATSWLWYMNMYDIFCWDNPTWGRSENQRFKDPLSPMFFLCWFWWVLQLLQPHVREEMRMRTISELKIQ